jgi:hypothetical protein
LYENPSDGTAPSFVLFVGDIDQVPTFDGTSGSHVTDLYYCEYTGDKLPEVYYGRFSAETTDELQYQIDKTLEVEKYEMPDPSYLDNVVLVAGVDSTYAPTHGNGAINYANDNYTNATNGITSYYYLYGDDSGVMASDTTEASASIISTISNGVSLANYTAHCSSDGWADPSFSISDIAGMNNEHMYPLLIGNCCLSSKFDDNDCFAEEIVYAQNEGAVGYIGGSNNSYWDEDYYWGVGLTSSITPNPTYADSELGAYDRAFHTNGETEDDWYVTAAQMIVAGNLGVEASSSTRKTYYWEIYHLMGDPSFTPYITVPTAITASYNNDVIIGSSTFTVNTEENAYVAFSKDGVLLDAKIADASGTVNLTFPGLSNVGTADIVITKQNRAPEIGTVNIIPSTTPYITLESYTIDDAAANNNGMADFGEVVNLDVTLKNVSDTYDALNVETELSTTDTNLIIIDSLETYGTIAALAESLKNGAFSISIDNNIEDQHILNFDLAITGDDESSNSYTWDSNINLAVNAPVLEIGDMTIDDSGTGNGDGILDPGETATVNVSTSNTGHADISNVIGDLTIQGGSSPYLTINSGTSSAYPLVVSATDIASFTVTADVTTPIGTPVDVIINLTGGIADQYSDITSKVIVIGEIPEYTIDQGGTVSTCVGLFYDSGNSSSEYSDDEDYTMTFTSATVGKNIQANFLSFDVEDDNPSCIYDKLSIYNGTSTSDALIGEYCGTTSPGVVTANNPDGALTFEFHSDWSVYKAGWEAEISCVDSYEVTFIVSDGSGLINGATISFNEEEKITNSLGECLFSNVNIQSGAEYTIRKTGYVDFTSSLDVVGQNVTENVTLVDAYDITFDITAEDGEIGVDAEVTFNGVTQIATEGTTTFTGLAFELDKQCTITAEGYFDTKATVDVDTDKTVEVAMNHICYSVSFNVEDREDKAFEGVKILFNSIEQITNSEGSTTFTKVNPDINLDYRITKDGYNDLTGSLDVVDENVIKNISFTSTVGIVSLADFHIKIYPNPTSDKFFIEGNEIINANVEIRNITGMLILSRKIKSIKTMIDLSSEAKGIYFIKIYNENKQIVGKIVVK